MSLSEPGGGTSSRCSWCPSPSVRGGEPAPGRRLLSGDRRPDAVVVAADDQLHGARGQAVVNGHRPPGACAATRAAAASSPEARLTVVVSVWSALPPLLATKPAPALFIAGFVIPAERLPTDDMCDPAVPGL
jgi:hypothetical protein